MKEYIKPSAEVVEFEPKDNIMDLTPNLSENGVEIW